MRLPPAPDSTGRWFREAEGRSLLAAESAACQESLGHVFGAFSAVFGVGDLDSELLAPLDFSARHIFAIGEGSGQFLRPVFARPSQLPLANESLTLIIVQHLLETMRDPAEFLGECDRILAPGGTLAVVGLNPTGRALRWRRDPPPWVRRWWTVADLRAAVDRTSAFDFEATRPILAEQRWWERLGRGRETRREGRMLGVLGSGYLAVFLKPRNGARVIPLGTSARRRAVAGATSAITPVRVGPAAANGHERRRASAG